MSQKSIILIPYYVSLLLIKVSLKCIFILESYLWDANASLEMFLWMFSKGERLRIPPNKCCPECFAQLPGICHHEGMVYGVSDTSYDTTPVKDAVSLILSLSQSSHFWSSTRLVDCFVLCTKAFLFAFHSSLTEQASFFVPVTPAKEPLGALFKILAV